MVHVTAAGGHQARRHERRASEFPRSSAKTESWAALSATQWSGASTWRRDCQHSLVTFGDSDAPRAERSPGDSCPRCSVARAWTAEPILSTLDSSQPSRMQMYVHCHQQHVLMSSAAAAWCRLRGKRVFVSELGAAAGTSRPMSRPTPGSTGTCTSASASRRIYRARAVWPRRESSAVEWTPNASRQTVAIARGGTVLFVGLRPAA